MFRGTKERKMAVLKAISEGIYSNQYVANQFDLTAQEISFDKQTLYKKDYIDRGFGNQVWVLTDLGEHALKHGFKMVHSESMKLRSLRIVHYDKRSYDLLARDLEVSKTALDYNVRWLKKHGFLIKKGHNNARPVISDKGLLALKDWSLVKHMEVENE